MPSSDQPTAPSHTVIPAPPSGVGAADLATDSTDPQVLRELLDRARERLAFYESFDRIIGENIRRSGELMVETVALREQAQVLAARSAEERAALAAKRQAERDHYRALIAQALHEVSCVRPVIDTMVTRLESVLAELGGDEESEDAATAVSPTSISTISALVDSRSTPPDRHEATELAPLFSSEEPTTDTDGEASVEEPAVETMDTAAEEEAPSAEAETAVTPEAPTTDGPRSIDVLAHGVPSARVAISLQKVLRDLDVVRSVEAREFANGELRLAVQATDALPQATLESWLADNNGELTGSDATVTEITFHGA